MNSMFLQMAKDAKLWPKGGEPTKVRKRDTTATKDRTMKMLPKILLAVSVVGFAASLTEPGMAMWFGILKPIAALSFVVAFIVHVVSSLDPEQYQADQRLRNELLHEPKPLKAIPLPAMAKAAAA